MLGKVSNLIQKNLSNLSGNLTGGGLLGIGGGIAGSLFDKARNSAQTNAAAAQILNKSPLEISDNSPIAHMKVNPFDSGIVFYPEDVQNLGTGHYMFIDILETTTLSIGTKNTQFNNSNRLDKDNKNTFNTTLGGTKSVDGKTTSRIIKPSSGMNKANNRHSRVVATVVLYTPPGIKTSYAVTHSGKEVGAAAGMIGSSSVADFIGRIGGGVKNFFLNAADAAFQIGMLGDIKSATQKKTGIAINNNMEMVFESVPMREFNYSFEFAPKNKKELDSSKKIIDLLKFHMHPDLGYTSDFIVPSQFQLTYMYREQQNNYIPKISRCVLTKLDLQHGDQNVFTTFNPDSQGASPIYTKMDLTFAETEIMTKTTMNMGM